MVRVVVVVVVVVVVGGYYCERRDFWVYLCDRQADGRGVCGVMCVRSEGGWVGVVTCSVAICPLNRSVSSDKASRTLLTSILTFFNSLSSLLFS